MARAIVIHAGEGSGPRSLSAFAGRYLGETEFALMQAYVADRLRPLLEAGAPGIVHGLEVGIDGAGEAARVTLRPGLAIGGDGRAIRVHAPIALDWPAVIEEHKQRTRAPDAPDTPLDGWFYMTVRRLVSAVTDPRDARPCDRDMLDILRDSRVETFATLDLQFIGAGSALMDPTAARAANRIAARARSAFAFDRDSGAVPVALVKIVADGIDAEEGRPVIDARAGRLLAGEHATQSAFLAQWQERADGLAADPLSFDPARDLTEQLGVDHLPPAGPLPSGLVQGIAGRPRGADWRGPELRFSPGALQVEITALPAGEIDEMVARELPRGPVDLGPDSADRLRIVVAVDERAWRPDLMDLPEADALLAEAVHRRQAEARAAWTEWARAWTGLYGGLDREALDEAGEPTGEARSLFRAVRPTAPPAGALPGLAGADTGAREALFLDPPVPVPAAGAAVFDRLIARRAERAEEEGTPLPRPYALGTPPPPEDLPAPSEPPDFAAEGLYRRLADLEREIGYLEAELDANDRLVADFDVFIRAQRQQVDSITTSFAALAGGVPGDGAGLQLARWMPFTQLAAVATTTEEDG